MSITGRAKQKIKQTGLTILNNLWSLRAGALSHRILYYHSVHPSTARSHRPQHFRDQLSWLRDQGIKGITMKEVPSHLDDPEPWVAITFDDGYRDNFEFALPELQRVGFSATVFVVAGLIDTPARDANEGNKLYRDRPMLTPQDIRALHDAGIEIGSHGWTHRMASRVAMASMETYRDEITRSLDFLSSITSAPVTSYAYPNGQRGAFSEKTRRVIQRAGVKQGATTLWGAAKTSSDLLALPRCEAADSDSLGDFKAKVCGQRDFRGLYQRVFDRSKNW